MFIDIIQNKKKCNDILMTVCDKIVENEMNMVNKQDYDFIYDNEMNMVNKQDYDFIYDIFDICINYLVENEE